jgi:C-terminal processing protease CtpA/Prc
MEACQMKNILVLMIIPALLVPGVILAQEPTGQADSGTRAEYETMLEEAELLRMEAESARREAVKAAEMARETARMSAELERRESEARRQMERESAQMRAELSQEEAQLRQRANEERARQRALQQQEMEQAREELSRAHRELREASREVARAHRDLSRSHEVQRTVRVVNLGDRPVIGVVLGEESPAGVRINGVSPDGPADRAGMEAGDILVTISEEDLTGDDSQGREAIFRVMSEAEPGEEIAVTVNREGSYHELSVIAEQREPRSWQSVIRIPEVETVEDVRGERHVIVERIQVPEIDEEALAEHVAELTEKLKTKKFLYVSPDGEDYEFTGDFDIDVEEFSDFTGHAMAEARVWFGMPHAQGLELVTVNEGLGAYFKTDRGVLVVRAREDNAYQLESGDVVLEIGSSEVNSPADMMRALREIDPGSEIEIEIKRNRKNKTLTVEMPENRLGFPH